MKKIILATLVAVFGVSAFGQKSDTGKGVSACEQRQEVKSYFQAASPELKASVWRGQLLIERRTATDKQKAYLDRIYKLITPEIYISEALASSFDHQEYLAVMGKGLTALDPTLIAYMKAAIGVLPNVESSLPKCVCRAEMLWVDDCPPDTVCFAGGTSACTHTAWGCGNFWLQGCDGLCRATGGEF